MDYISLNNYSENFVFFYILILILDCIISLLYLIGNIFTFTVPTFNSYDNAAIEILIVIFIAYPCIIVWIILTAIVLSGKILVALRKETFCNCCGKYLKVVLKIIAPIIAEIGFYAHNTYADLQASNMEDCMWNSKCGKFTQEDAEKYYEKTKWVRSAYPQMFYLCLVCFIIGIILEIVIISCGNYEEKNTNINNFVQLPQNNTSQNIENNERTAEA